MLLAEIGSTPYDILLLLHILAVVVGFAPAWLTPALVRASGDSGRAATEALEMSVLRYSLPGLGLAGILGFGLVGLSDEVFELSQAWVLVSIVLWIALFAVTRLVTVPGIRAFREGDSSARGKVMAGTGVVHLILVVTLFLMIFKPGA